MLRFIANSMLGAIGLVSIVIGLVELVEGFVFLGSLFFVVGIYILRKAKKNGVSIFSALLFLIAFVWGFVSKIITLGLGRRLAR